MVRMLMAVLMGAGILAAVWWLPAWGYKLLVFCCAALGLVEFGRMFFNDQAEKWGLFAAGSLVSATVLFCPGRGDAVVILLSILLFSLSLFVMRRMTSPDGAAARLGLMVLGALYLGVSFSLWGWVRDMHYGRELVLLALVPACLCDTFAFIAGKLFGKHKFAPMTSPNKTMEGFAGALVGSLIGVFAVRFIIISWIPWHYAAIFAIIIWIVSPFGDLIESLLKRSCGVKDSGSIIPGHGGILDRLDALIFSGSAAYIFGMFLL